LGFGGEYLSKVCGEDDFSIELLGTSNFASLEEDLSLIIDEIPLVFSWFSEISEVFEFKSNFLRKKKKYSMEISRNVEKI